MRKKLPLAALFLVCGLVAGIFIGRMTAPEKNSCRLNPIRENNDGYDLINPLLFCEAEELSHSPEIHHFQDQVVDFIREEKKKKNLEVASVYFRDYQAKEYFEIAGNEHYAPASLLKVPLMIAYLKIADKNPSLLSEMLFFSGKTDYTDRQNFKPTQLLEKGKYYSIEDLLKSMIFYSDNNARQLLADYVDVNTWREIYTDLYLPLPPGFDETNPADLRNINPDFLTVKGYAYFFRLLFNSTYLSREMSEKALDWLSQSDFQDGIRAGIPKNIRAALKFGERSFGPFQSKELHDCGIVYYPEKPYLLCVMTKGQDFGELSKAIQHISEMAYGYIDEKKKN